jgi:hypothetical protein
MTQYGNCTFHPQDQHHKPITTKFDGMPAHKLDAIINRAAMTNQQRTDEALTKADAYAFQVANPQFKRTDKNTRVMNHWLSSRGIENHTYEDFAHAFDALNGSGLIDVDENVAAPRTFTGTFSKKTFGNIEELVLNERAAALQSMSVSEEELALEGLPLDQFKELVNKREHTEQRRVNSLKTNRAGDAWVLATPVYRDIEHNAKLMLQQMAANGVIESAATIRDYQVAYEQLFPTGLLTLNQVALKKQHQEELMQEAAEELTPELTEEEMYDLPLEELEKRARLVSK